MCYTSIKNLASFPFHMGNPKNLWENACEKVIIQAFLPMP